jgi:hypothetical protein
VLAGADEPELRREMKVRTALGGALTFTRATKLLQATMTRLSEGFAATDLIEAALVEKI